MRDPDTIARQEKTGGERDRLRPWQTHGSPMTAQTAQAGP